MIICKESRNCDRRIEFLELELREYKGYLIKTHVKLFYS